MRTLRRTWPLLAAALLAALPASAAETPAVAASPGVDLPIRAVTVYSDRARVVRRGKVAGKGRKRLELPELPPTAEPGSVRLSAEKGTVVRVEVRFGDPGQVPRTEGEALLRHLEVLDDELAALADRLRALEEERRLVAALRPAAPLHPSPELPPALLDPAGWAPSLAFLEERAAALDQASAPLTARARVVRKERAQAAEQARQLAAAATGMPPLRVFAEVELSGETTLELAYLARGARWTPSYDLRFVPGGTEVEVQLAGLVSQSTGEDWPASALTLSTAVPATTVALPRPASWRIGEKDTFVPTPVPAPVAVAPAGPAAAPRGSTGKDGDGFALSQRLLEKAAEEREADDSRADYFLPEGGKGKREKKKVGIGAPAAPPPPPERAPLPKPAANEDKAFSGLFEFGGEAAGAMEAPASDTSAYRDESMGDWFAQGEVSSLPSGGHRVTLVAPGRFEPPPLASDAPAFLAGGYTFVYPAALPEAVRSGGEARRVLLHTVKLPASPHVTVAPALSKQAYAVAEVVNRTSRPLLQGRANLFVGADLTGVAVLPTVAAGGKATLPLGVDEAIQVERTVRPTTAEKGVFFKDDVTVYEVSIELKNPRRTKVSVKLLEQVPLPGGGELEVELLSMSPKAAQDPDLGYLDWTLELAPGEKKVVSFRYQLTRPRGARLRQW